MKYRNTMNYPEYVVEWLKRDDYDYEPGTLSATSLIQPIRKTLLELKHAEELECDVSDCIPKRYGTALHDSFEAMDFGDDIKQEERFWTDIVFDDEHIQKISGKFDMLVREPNGDRLVDIKSTSAWSFIYGSRDDDHRLQMSILRYILMRNGKNVIDVAHILYIFTDWKRSDAKRQHNYPEQRIIVKPLELLSQEKTEEWIRNRILELKKSRGLPDHLLPQCSDVELWKKDDVYAVMKRDRIKAVKLFDTREDADTLAKTDTKLYIEQRRGLAQRCGYCYARPFCSQYDEMKAGGEVE